MAKPNVTVYILCHNYGHFLEEAIESVLAQTYSEWELILVNDGSTDNTAIIIEQYVSKYSEKIIPVTNKTSKGIQTSANEILEIARGAYIVRLDADDYLDENALLVMAHFLDRNPKVALVYPNYIYVDKQGLVLGVEQRKQIGREAELLDLPAHGACTMIRKRVLKNIGGYNEAFDRQDGYDIWFKIFDRYEIATISTPLFYYRQHDASLTRNEDALLDTRAKIARQRQKSLAGSVQANIVAVVGVKNTYRHLSNIALERIAGKPLIDYTLDAAFSVGEISKILVATDDSKVVEHCKIKYPESIPYLRPSELSDASIKEYQIYIDSVNELEKRGVFPDIIVGLNIHCPLRIGSDIQMTIDTLKLYDVDNVISVYEDLELHYVHGKNGMIELNPAMHQEIRLEREALFVSNGAINVFWRDLLSDQGLSLRQIGHVVMPKNRSFQIKNEFDAWVIEQIMNASNFVTKPSNWKLK